MTNRPLIVALGRTPEEARRSIGAIGTDEAAVPSVRTVSGNYNALPNDVVLVNTAGGARLVTLPTPMLSIFVSVKKATPDDNTVTVQGSGGAVIDNAVTLILNNPYTAITLYCDGTDWWIF